jgi:ribosomal protein L16 Arg81 hydroxylase
LLLTKRTPVPLQATLGLEVNINLYVTPGGRRALAVHYDTTEIMILQLAGRKDWEVSKPVIELPRDTEPRYAKFFTH